MSCRQYAAVWCLAALAAAGGDTAARAAQTSAGQSSTSQREFDALLARAKRSDPTVDFSRLRKLYSETELYTPNRDSEEGELMSAYSSRDFARAREVGARILERNYMNVNVHIVTTLSCTALKDDACTDHHDYMMKGLLDSIVASGDGTSPATALVVISATEEYAVTAVMGLSVVSQSLVERDGHRYDLLVARDALTGIEREIYFNIDLAFAALKRMIAR